MTSARTEAPMPVAVDFASRQQERAGGVGDVTVSADGDADKSMVSIPMYRGRRVHGVGLSSAAPAPAPPPRPTVLARTLALAHRMQAMLEDGRAKNRADIAAKLGFSRARITQIMDLLWLAPDIQEEILFSISPTGRDEVTTTDVKGIVRLLDWAEQRRLWQRLRTRET